MTNELKSGFRGGKNKTKQKVVEFKGRRERKKQKKTGLWRCHGDQTPTSVAYNGKGSLEASEDD